MNMAYQMTPLPMTLKVTVAVWNLFNLHQALFLGKFGLHRFAVCTSHLVHSAHNSDHKSNPIQRVVTGAGIWWHVSATLFFSATTHYFSKNIVLWQVCHNTLLFESQHITFQKILCCAPCPQHNIFEKNNVLWQKKNKVQIHASILTSLL